MIQNSSTSESAHLGGSGLSRVLVEVVVSERLPNGPLLVKHEAVWGGGGVLGLREQSTTHRALNNRDGLTQSGGPDPRVTV